MPRMIYAASLATESAIVQESVQSLHTSMQPLHTFFESHAFTPNFAAFIIACYHISYMATKQENEKKRSLARALFLSGMEMGEIAEKVDVSRVTISKWCAADGWKEARAAKNITRPELVNKLLAVIYKLLEQIDESDDLAAAGLADKLAKLAAVIEKLDKKANVIDAIEVFMAFSKWLEYRAATDPDVTPELIKAINKYQDKYIIESIGSNTLK